ncbi:hypothetical protein M747DRAFT_250299 [Aspergillus niger ATCC 13496]|uniref:Uncharacterized protein n=3 Tax=Aspergillus niger TaxID=5061 RepID=A2R8N0_ASPNC|nr:hypothetical protein An16g07730 [Aspergillus niger]RDH14081.1 hypothetical protein M747DRAFT_250299 [Aspergillus niger ATCC 13496]CAL00545.1 hypothetical protein An16g07730 [Aspergillus niger]
MDGCQYLPFRAQLRRDKNMGSAFVVVQFSQPLSMSTYQIRFSLLPLGFPNLDSGRVDEPANCVHSIGVFFLFTNDPWGCQGDGWMTKIPSLIGVRRLINRIMAIPLLHVAPRQCTYSVSETEVSPSFHNFATVANDDYQTPLSLPLP